jgi:hypothetical protein
MVVFELHPWARFFAGVVTGCWIGVVVGCAVALLLAGRKVRQLETINRVLRNRLKARTRPQRTGTGGGGPMLVMPIPGAERRAEKPASRIARFN